MPGETLLEALPRMREAYCGTIAYQFEHLSSHHQRTWLREMVETGAHRQPLTDDEKRRLLERLIDVFEFERFIEKAYLGQKIFSIEGLDAIVPMLDELATLAGRAGAEEAFSEWPTGAGSASSPTTSAARWSRSSPSSRGRSRSSR